MSRPDLSLEIAAEAYAETVYEEMAADAAYPDEPTEADLNEAFASAYEGKLMDLLQSGRRDSGQTIATADLIG